MTGASNDNTSGPIVIRRGKQNVPLSFMGAALPDECHSESVGGGHLKEAVPSCRQIVTTRVRLMF